MNDIKFDFCSDVRRLILAYIDFTIYIFILHKLYKLFLKCSLFKN